MEIHLQCLNVELIQCLVQCCSEKSKIIRLRAAHFSVYRQKMKMIFQFCLCNY